MAAARARCGCPDCDPLNFGSGADWTPPETAKDREIRELKERINSLEGKVKAFEENQEQIEKWMDRLEEHTNFPRCSFIN